MRLSTFSYSLKQGMKNITRNKKFSFASIITMAACIFMFSVFFSVLVNFSNMVKEAESSVAVTVFFDEGISEQRINEIGDIIKKRVEVSEVKFVSAEEALASFIHDYFGDEDKELAEAFLEDNPLADSANYEVYLNDISMQGALVTYLNSVEGVREVKQSEVAAKTLSDFNKLLGYISIAIIVILLGVAIFLISNTVTIGISVRQEEIYIMKLIGATDAFVRAPFIVEGIMIGLIGAIIPLIIFYFVYNGVVSYILGRFSILEQLLSFMTVGEVYRILLPVALALGVGIGFLGSFFTVRKHLNK
ncbi:MAG: ABC transporter permease [Lachnospiraceae bacterium]|jgi:cell division transport system permease protein|nr:ABC transporter permease [Lachnospiraceae bacterium]